MDNQVRTIDKFLCWVPIYGGFHERQMVYRRNVGYLCDDSKPVRFYGSAFFHAMSLIVALALTFSAAWILFSRLAQVVSQN